MTPRSLARLWLITCLASATGPAWGTARTRFATPAADRQRPTNRGSQQSVPAAAVSFRDDLLPIFRDNCTMCHQGEIPMGALTLTPDAAFANLVGAQSAGAKMLRVAPGQPERSYLYYKVSGKNALVNGSGIAMPWGGALSPVQLEQITRWIKQGARDN